jgi:endoglycosylceramidase
MDRSVAAAERDGAPVMVTEWGATNDPAFLDQIEDQFDARLLPWMYWAYNGHVVGDSNLPLVAPNLNTTVLTALSRPYPTVVNGTPTSLSFESETATMDLRFTTTRPDGRRAPFLVPSAISVPKLRYPGGYVVTAVGADVTSRPCASTLTLRNRPNAATVSVRITPGPCR